MARMAFILPSASLGLGGGGGGVLTGGDTSSHTHPCGVQRAKHRSATLNQHDPGKRGIGLSRFVQKGVGVRLGWVVIGERQTDR